MLREYEVQTGYHGRTTTLQLSDEDAKARGLDVPGQAKAAKAPANKQAPAPPNKVVPPKPVAGDKA